MVRPFGLPSHVPIRARAVAVQVKRFQEKQALGHSRRVAESPAPRSAVIIACRVTFDTGPKPPPAAMDDAERAS
jgi:hypothetical protein